MIILLVVSLTDEQVADIQNPDAKTRTEHARGSGDAAVVARAVELAAQTERSVPVIALDVADPIELFDASVIRSSQPSGGAPYPGHVQAYAQFRRTTGLLSSASYPAFLEQNYGISVESVQAAAALNDVSFPEPVVMMLWRIEELMLSTGW